MTVSVRAADSRATASSFFATLPGRLVLVAAFAVLLAITNAVAWPAVALALALTSILPQHRRTIAIVASIGVLIASPPLDLNHLAALASMHDAEALVSAWPLAAVLTIAGGWAWAEFVRRSPKSPAARRPVLALVLVFIALLVIGGDAPLRGGTWLATVSLAMCLSSYLWFFAYAASDAKLQRTPPAHPALGYWRPFWGFSNVPIGKGRAYLERVEARDDAALAAVQTSGLRLMASCAVLFYAMFAIRWAVYAPHGPQTGAAASLLWWLPPDGLPPIAGLIDRQANGAPYPFATRWAAMLAEFAMTVLHMTTWGNSIVATCRMAGYDIALNTDRPLLSTSIAEFYNRYYFYFKELLATFFFYPTYLALRRTTNRVRLFVATVAAAGFGNFLFHFLRDSDEVFRVGFVTALHAYRSYALYALVLGTAIAVSQVRLLARHRRSPAGVRRVLATAGVLLFYCLLGVLDVRSPYDIADYAAVYVSLFVP